MDAGEIHGRFNGFAGLRFDFPFLYYPKLSQLPLRNPSMEDNFGLTGGYFRIILGSVRECYEEFCTHVGIPGFQKWYYRKTLSGFVMITIVIFPRRFTLKSLPSITQPPLCPKIFKSRYFTPFKNSFMPIG